MNGSLLRTGTCLVAIAFGACATHDDARAPTTLAEEISARWPAAAGMLARAPDGAIASDERGSSLRSALAPSRRGFWRTLARPVRATLDADGTFSIDTGRGSVSVRRVSGGPPTLEPGERSVGARDAAAGIDALWIPLETGVEELLRVSDASAEIAYELDLPGGWRASSPAGHRGIVEIADARGTPWLRVVAREGWDATGRAVRVEPEITGARLSLRVVDPFDPPLLVDPEWQSTASLLELRLRATASLLPDGRVWIAGGRYSSQETVLGTTEVLDPTTATVAAGPELATRRFDHVALPIGDGTVLLAGGHSTLSVSDMLASIERWDGRTAEVQSGGDLAHERARFTATRLLDGRVLFAGGNALDAPELRSAEIFDPVTGQSTLIQDPAPFALEQHAATLLRDGRVLLTGGAGALDGTCSAAAAVWDPIAPDTISLVASMTKGRCGHAAIRLPDDRVLIVGGRANDQEPGNDLSDGELFDPSIDAFVALETGEALDTGRAHMAAALLGSGKVLLASGESNATGNPFPHPIPVKAADLFDFAAPPGDRLEEADAPLEYVHPTLVSLPGGEAVLLGRNLVVQMYDGQAALGRVPSPSPALSVVRNYHATTILPDGDVLVAGGDDASDAYTTLERWDATTGQIQVLGPSAELPGPTTALTATLLFDGKVLLAGGAASAVGPSLTAAHLFDASSRTLTATGPLSAPRVAHVATLLADGRVLVSGGVGEGTAILNTAEVYDPRTGTFTPAASVMVSQRWLHTATLLRDGTVLLAGGQGTFGSPDIFQTTEIFDPVTLTFTAGPDMSAPRFFHTATPLADGRVLFAGGAASAAAEVFHAATKKFESLPEASIVQRYQHTATVLPDGRVLLAGGDTGTVGVTNELELFDPATDTFTAVAEPMANKRVAHTATLLVDGGVLLIGGSENGSLVPSLATTERWTLSTPIAPADRTSLSAVPWQVTPGEPATIAGTLVSPIGEGSGGPHPSPAGGPVAMWMSLAGPAHFGVLRSWSSTGAQWAPPAVDAPGPGILFPMTHGSVGRGMLTTVLRAPDGIACSNDVQCASGFCTDGVCCNERCDGTCSACSGVDGTCGFVPAGPAPASNPDGECTPQPECPAATGMCDGNGACTTCPSTSATCDGDHTLVGQDGTIDCAPFRCRADVCLATCTSKVDCIAGYVCTAAGACAEPFADEPASTCSAGPSRASHGHAAVGVLLALLVAARARRMGDRARGSTHASAVNRALRRDARRRAENRRSAKGTVAAWGRCPSRS